MLPQILMAFAIILAARPTNAQTNLAATNGDAAVEVLRGSEVWDDFGRAGTEIRVGRPQIRVHEADEQPAGFLRIHPATVGSPPDAIPTHGLADAFDPPRIPVQRLHRGSGETRIRVHGFGLGTVFGFSDRRGVPSSQ